MRKNSQDAVTEFRPYFDNAPVYGHGPSLEDFTEQTPLTVGSPQEVIDRTLGFREHFGDYQRQLFLMDHAGLPLKTVLEQLDLLGGEVVPVLRKEFDAMRPAHVPTAPRTPLVPARRCRQLSETDAHAVVVTAGLSQPSSTRLLADRLAAATSRARPDAVETVVIELRDTGARHRQQPADRLRQSGKLRQALDAVDRRRRADRRHADLQRLVQRAVQVVLRRARTRARWPASRC